MEKTTKLSLTFDRKDITCTFDFIDPLLEDFFGAFEAMLVAYGFSYDNIKLYYLQKCEELKEDEDE